MTNKEFKVNDRVYYTDLDNKRHYGRVYDIVKDTIGIAVDATGGISRVPVEACSHIETSKPFFLKKERVVYSDVDDTLIAWEPEKYPDHDPADIITFTDDYGQWHFLKNTRNIQFIKNLKRQGYGVVVWSAAGAEWANKVVKMLELEPYVDVVLSKPEIAVDDLLDAKRIIKTVIWIDPMTGDYKRNE